MTTTIDRLVAERREMTAYADVLHQALTDIVRTPDLPASALLKLEDWNTKIKAQFARVKSASLSESTDG